MATTPRTLQRPATGPAKRTRKGTQVWVSRLLLILFSVALLLPLYWMIATALKTDQELAVFPPTLFPQNPQWSNFREAVEYIPFFRFLRNTLSVTALTIVGAVVSNPLIAYGFSRLEWPGRDKVFMLVLASVFIPFPVVIIALFDIFAKLGWINTFLPLVVPIFFGSAFWIFLMRQFLMQIPMDISDAGRIDGANEFQVFSQLILPLTLPAVGVIGIFAALHAWNDFIGPLIYLQDESRYTLAIGLTFFRSQYDVQFNLLMAASTLVVLPVVVIFLLFQRAFLEGITLGSIK
ncbi:MAG: N-acetyl-D-glucosamine ABC transporter, permease protein 2 [uncultured Truepera sp.]|uniref:N-acetyl-D-glucosamine ABC transporter, permease protein 2 n=1 Tax=uncultured Truepera sp. TaxID=543023 RepID=A0A6J4USC9_9DEIN|nr:MAG: N-acetyl-D-glucosamine ABC transporter, permease protein 2 [uncultured Truepera sp.]